MSRMCLTFCGCLHLRAIKLKQTSPVIYRHMISHSSLQSDNCRRLTSPLKHYLRKLKYAYQNKTKVFNVGKKSGLVLGCVTLTLLHTPAAALCEPAYKNKGTRISSTSTLSSKHCENDDESELPWTELWKLLLPEWRYIVAAIGAAFVVAILNIQIPMQLGNLVNAVSEFTHETAHSYMEDMTGPALNLVYLYSLQAMFTAGYISMLACAGERVAVRMRKQLFHSIVIQDINFFDTHKTGEVINRLTTDVQDFKSSFKLCISQGLRSLTQTIGCVISLFTLSPKLTLVMVVVVPGIVGTGMLLGSLLRSLSQQAQAQVARATGVADEALGNVRTVRAFAMEQKEIELYNAEIEKSLWLNEKLGFGIAIFQGLSNLALNGIVLGVMYIGGSLMASHEIKPGDLMSFLVATQTIQRSLAQMSLLFGQAVRGFSAGSRVFQYIKLTPEIPTSGGTRIKHEDMCGNVEFSHVSFSYPSRPEQTVLRDFDLKIPGGKMVALCGLSGGGKSTVASLLERFYDVSSGTVKIDGHNVKDLDPKWLRGEAIGFINQEPVLFATSVMENIRYGRPCASDREVIEAAKLAHADNFIRTFPDSYQTILGERGITVSGGQKQRIAIARALLKDPQILILDEATSALDAESERVVQEALDEVTKGRTVLVIAHRLSTIQNADIIAVVSHGKIAEVGTHVTLKRKRGLYWELIRLQQQDDDNT